MTYEREKLLIDTIISIYDATCSDVDQIILMPSIHKAFADYNELRDTAPAELDPRTGRPFGDHGTANDAIEFALDDPKSVLDRDLCNMEGFLKSWRCGNLDEFPEFYQWLKEQGR